MFSFTYFGHMKASFHGEDSKMDTKKVFKMVFNYCPLQRILDAFHKKTCTAIINYHKLLHLAETREKSSSLVHILHVILAVQGLPSLGNLPWPLFWYIFMHSITSPLLNHHTALPRSNRQLTQENCLLLEGRDSQVTHYSLSHSAWLSMCSINARWVNKRKHNQVTNIIALIHFYFLIQKHLKQKHYSILTLGKLNAFLLTFKSWITYSFHVISFVSSLLMTSWISHNKI